MEPNKVLKNAVQKIIANISIIAIFIALGIIAMSYAGLTFDITIQIVASVAVPSIILAISSIIIYELWVRSGIENARSEQEYVDLQITYQEKSKNLDNAVMQEFIDAEKERRYKVEEKRLSDEIEKLESVIKALENSLPEKTNKKDSWTTKITKLRLKLSRKRLKDLEQKKDSIHINMPYTYSEQFDELRYNTADYKFREYKPSDTATFMRKKRRRKYIWTITLTIVGINLINPHIGGQNWFIALFMTCIAAISLLISLFGGFSNGYNSIAIYNTGVYKTAIDFIGKAKAYCDKYGKQLYVIKDQVPEIPDNIKPEVHEPERAVTSQITMNIFDKIEQKSNIKFQ